MERITADTFAAFNRQCHAERLEKAERYFEWAQDVNNTPAQCAYWAGKSKRLARDMDHFQRPTLINKVKRALRKLFK